MLQTWKTYRQPPDAARSCGTPTELCGTGAETFLSVKIHELGVLLSP